MAFLPKLAFAVVLAAATLSANACHALLPPLAARLHGAGELVLLDGGPDSGGGMMDCWNALMQLKSCTSEIVLFFLNGESYLGVECCVAIRTITRHCWPSMLSSLGFTAEEGDILRGFCDAEVGGAPPAPVVPSPAPAPAPEVGKVVHA